MGYRMKTHKGAAKRFKVTARGKIKFKRSFSGHLMSSKSGKRCRRLRKAGYLQKTEAQRILRRIAV
jgi:large subunit ribosomal protein L35